MSRPTILVMSFTETASDPRVYRQLRFLHGDYELISLGYGEAGVEGVTAKPLPRRRADRKAAAADGKRLLDGRFEEFYWCQPPVVDGLEVLRGVTADLVIANDLETLPLALEVAAGAPVVFDAHEYGPGQFEDQPFWAMFYRGYQTYLASEYVHRAAAMTTVSPGLVEAYRQLTGVEAMVLTNAPDHHDLPVRPVDPRHIRLVSHGTATRSRRIECLIEMMTHLDDRYRLDLLLVDGTPGYLQQLREHAQADGRISFPPPVPMTELVRRISSYDVGVVFQPPTNANHRASLPNKLFESIQARLAVVASASDSMEAVLTHHGCGVVAREATPEAMAECLDSLNPQRLTELKHASARAAGELSSQANGVRLRELVSRLLDT